MHYLFAQPTVLDQVTQAPITALIVATTVLISYLAFKDENLRNKLIFAPAHMHQQGMSEMYRFITAGFIHANWLHLLFNALVLWEFGRIVEMMYKANFESFGTTLYLALYFGGLILSSLYSYFKHKHNHYYYALGASGAVSGVLFAAIVFMPLLPLGLIFVPFLRVPAIAMGILYLLYSYYMGRKGTDNIGHDAHFWGAVWGFAFTLLCGGSDLFQLFIAQISGNF